MTEAERLLREARDEFQHLAEYWNGSSNERALTDTCEHTTNEAERWMNLIDAYLSRPAPSAREAQEGQRGRD